MRRILLAGVFVLVASTLSAQTPVVNPTTLEFLVSADHDALDMVGQPQVVSYQFDAIGQNGLGAIAITVDLGKPVPNATGLVVLTLPQFANLTPNILYTATVTANGPGGSGVSAVSNPFGRAVQVPPRAPGKPVLRP